MTDATTSATTVTSAPVGEDLPAREAASDDAPVWLSAEAANGWANGFNAARESVIEVVLTRVPCVCDPAYHERGLEDPVCSHHDLARVLGTAQRSPQPSAERSELDGSTRSRP